MLHALHALYYMKLGHLPLAWNLLCL